MLTWGWRKNGLQVKRNAWEYQGAMIKTIWSWGMAWELWQPETWHSEMVQALLAANSQGAELQRLMVEGALEHVSLWMTWEPMRNVAGNQKDLESFHASRPHNCKGFAQVVPNSPVVHGIVLQGRRSLGEIHQNDVRGPFFWIVHDSRIFSDSHLILIIGESSLWYNHNLKNR